MFRQSCLTYFNPHAAPVDIGSMFNSEPVIDNVTDVKNVAMITIVSTVPIFLVLWISFVVFHVSVSQLDHFFFEKFTHLLKTAEKVLFKSVYLTQFFLSTLFKI